MMEALQILKYSLQYGWDLNFTEGLDWDNELAEMEGANKAQLHTPEDLDSFTASLGLGGSNSASDLDLELDLDLDLDADLDML